MAVKIITPGVIAGNVRYTHTCAGCRCVFEFAGSDARLRHGGQMDGDALVIPCPTCQRECWTDVRRGGYCGPG